MKKYITRLLILSFINNTASASPQKATFFTKGETCGALFLKLIQDKRYDVSGRDEETYNTVLAFKNFRLNKLRDYHSSRLGFENINTHSVEAKKYQKSQVADRIRGLEKVYEWNYTPIKGDEEYIAMGTQIKGRA